MATYKATALGTKQYTLYIEAENEEEAWNKADKTELFGWEEDCVDDGDVDVEHIEKVDDE